MSKIITPEKLPEGEKIYLKKGGFVIKEWRVVHPIKDENGKIIWTNFLFGGWSNLITLFIYFLIGTTIYLGISEQFANLAAISSDPCSYCQQKVNEINFTGVFKR